MPVEGLADMAPNKNPSNLTSNTLHEDCSLQHPRLVRKADETVAEEIVACESSVNEIKTPDPGARDASTDLLPPIDKSLTSRAQRTSMLSSSQEPSVSCTSAIPERRPRQMARRGGRSAHSSRLRHRTKETTTASAASSSSDKASDRLVDLGVTAELCGRFSLHGIYTIAQFKQLGVQECDFKSICRFVKEQDPDCEGETQAVETYLLQRRIFPNNSN